jgi:mitotic-spindle organizing protein 1
VKKNKKAGTQIPSRHALRILRIYSHMNAKPTQARETLDGAPSLSLKILVCNLVERFFPPLIGLLAALHEVSRMLNTGLDKETLGLLVALCEAGVNPEALAHGIRELHRTSEGGPGTKQ